MAPLLDGAGLKFITEYSVLTDYSKFCLFFKNVKRTVLLFMKKGDSVYKGRCKEGICPDTFFKSFKLLVGKNAHVADVASHSVQYRQLII